MLDVEDFTEDGEPIVELSPARFPSNNEIRGELVAQIGERQPKVSTHLACLRWCGFVEGRRERRTVRYQIADRRVTKMLGLARGLLHDNAEHVAACRAINGAPG